MSVSVSLPTSSGDRLFEFDSGDGVATPYKPVLAGGAATEATLESLSSKFLLVDLDTTATEQLAPLMAIGLPGSGGGVIGGTIANPIAVRVKAISPGFETVNTNGTDGSQWVPLPNIPATEVTIRNGNNVQVDVSFVSNSSKIFPIFAGSDTPPIEGITNLSELQIKRSDNSAVSVPVYLMYLTRS